MHVVADLPADPQTAEVVQEREGTLGHQHFRLYHLPARLADHARHRWLRTDSTWPWATAFTTCWQRLTDLPAIT